MLTMCSFGRNQQTSIHELQTLQCEQRGGRYIRQVVHHFIRIVTPLISTFLNRGAALPFSALISSSEAAQQQVHYKHKVWTTNFTQSKLETLNWNTWILLFSIFGPTFGARDVKAYWTIHRRTNSWSVKSQTGQLADSNLLKLTVRLI